MTIAHHFWYDDSAEHLLLDEMTAKYTNWKCDVYLKEKGADTIAEHMNYGLYKVEGKQDCPKDALNICRLLDLDPEIIKLAENYY